MKTGEDGEVNVTGTGTETGEPAGMDDQRGEVARSTDLEEKRGIGLKEWAERNEAEDLKAMVDTRDTKAEGVDGFLAKAEDPRKEENNE